jgi:predicted amidophosphoribosyltransferase
VGAEPVVACQNCGHPLSADATFCAHCGRPVETSDEAEPEPEAEGSAVDETIMHSADPWER